MTPTTTTTPSASTVTNAPTEAAAPEAASASPYDICASWTGLADYSIANALLDPVGVADVLVPSGWNDSGFWTFEPLGDDGVDALIDELTSEQTICDGSPSPTASTAIEQFVAAGGGSANREILFDALGVVPSGFRRGTDSANEPVSPRQRYQDAAAMAASAAQHGDEEAARQLVDLAISMLTADARALIEAGATAQELLAIAASGQLFDIEDLSDEAMQALYEQIKQEVADAAADFDPCAVMGSSRNSALIEALARAELFGIPDTGPSEASEGKQAYDQAKYNQLILDWIERNEAVANGEEDDVCPGYLFRVEMPWAAGLSSGTLEVWLMSCDTQTWTGTLTSSGEMVLPDGSMAFERAYELTFEFGPNEFRDGVLDEIDLDGRLQWRLEGSGFSGDWSTQAATGRASFRWLESFGEFRAEFDNTTLNGQITAGGHSVPVSFPTEFPPVHQLTTLAPGGDLCNDDA
jgi:hypothetical protein